MKFDIMWLESFDEKIIMETIGSKITPLVVNPGKIILSNLNLYFQPFNNIEPVSKMIFVFHSSYTLINCFCFIKYFIH